MAHHVGRRDLPTCDYLRPDQIEWHMRNYISNQMCSEYVQCFSLASTLPCFASSCPPMIPFTVASPLLYRQSHLYPNLSYIYPAQAAPITPRPWSLRIHRPRSIPFHNPPLYSSHSCPSPPHPPATPPTTPSPSQSSSTDSSPYHSPPPPLLTSSPPPPNNALCP